MSFAAESPVKIKAGIATFDETTGQCTPSNVQGEITIKPNEEEEELGFYDFEWKPLDSEKSTTENISLILIPGETLLTQIKSCLDGRMFSLIFSSNEKYFFWLQDKNPKNIRLNELNKNDKQFFEKLNRILAVEDDSTD